MPSSVAGRGDRRQDAAHQRVQIRPASRVAFPGRPRCKILVIGRRVRPGLHLETDYVSGQDGNRVPDAGLNIDSDRIAAQDVGAGNMTGVVESEITTRTSTRSRWSTAATAS